MAHKVKKILILGVNGFIGHHLSHALLHTEQYEIFGIDLQTHRLQGLSENPRFHFFQGDVLIEKKWIDDQVKMCDLVIPLVAIATPASYVKEPLRVFELDFESNLEIVRLCVKYKKKLIFPSTSEVYGMCTDENFHPDKSPLIYGPIEKQRWIYASSKQLLDRVIYAYGVHEGLNYTIFRPFNWIGPGLDTLFNAKAGSSRVVTQFLGHLTRGENITLVDGGVQKRCFTDIEDGINCLQKIIENTNNVTNKKIYNIGNPLNNHSIRELAIMMLQLAKERVEFRGQAQLTQIVDQAAEEYYGNGFQEIQNRRPWIQNTQDDLAWTPRYTLKQSLVRIFNFYSDLKLSRPHNFNHGVTNAVHV